MTWLQALGLGLLALVAVDVALAVWLFALTVRVRVRIRRARPAERPTAEERWHAEREPLVCCDMHRPEVCGSDPCCDLCPTCHDAKRLGLQLW